MLKAIWTFDHRIMSFDKMGIAEVTYAKVAYYKGWILGIDENDNLNYWDPERSETVTMDNLKGKIMTRDDREGGAGVVAEIKAPPAASPEPAAAPEQPEQPAAPEQPEPQVPAAAPETVRKPTTLGNPDMLPA